MTTLSFPLDNLGAIAAHSALAKKFTKPYEAGEFDEEFRGFYLVKDDGIYLMSNANVAQQRPDGKGRLVVYADGFDPEIDEGVHDKAASAVGGDDFAEWIPFEWFERARDAHKTHLVLKVTPMQISYAGD